MRWLLRLFLYLPVVLLLVGAVAAALLLEPEPLVPTTEAPTADDVQAARGLLGRFRATTEAPPEERRIELSGPEIASLLALGQRAIPGARGQTALGDGILSIRGSIPLRLIDEGPWINLSARVPDFDNGLALASMRVGRIELRPALAVGLAKRAVSLWLGGAAGADLIAAFPAMRTTPERVTLGIAVDGDGRGDIARTLFSAFRGDSMPGVAEVDHYRRVLVDALDAGTLAPAGSFAPHLALVLEHAYRRGAGGDLGREYTAAVFALTDACGSEHLRPYIAKLLPDGGKVGDQPVLDSPCGEAALHGRIDLRRHFITAAALRAASNRGVAVSIGEFKELSDMTGSSGFDFTDIVANNSGIRLSDRLMAAPPEAWPALLAMLGRENNVIAPLDGVPAAMSMRDFETTYGDLQSAPYMNVLDGIEARIDTLPLHRTEL